VTKRKSNFTLVTGGAGYIGSHCLVELIKNGYNPIVVDNLSNSSLQAIKNVEKITKKKIIFYNQDLGNKKKLEQIFLKYFINSVIHFAGLKSVEESYNKPLKYYRNNINISICLLETMQKFNVKKLIFSSSASVYGDAINMPINEKEPVRPTNPYARSKSIIEKMCLDIIKSDENLNKEGWKILLLRYFNPIGAHKSGMIGEDPKNTLGNIMPILLRVANKEVESFKIFGDDYNTPDGTGIRDYIHVMDLARGHLAALKYILKLDKKKSLCRPINLGNGTGVSVIKIINEFNKITKKNLNITIERRRKGDPAMSYADVRVAKKLLGWKTKENLHSMIKDTWNWKTKNPDGYK